MKGGTNRRPGQRLLSAILLCFVLIAQTSNADDSCKKGCPQSDNGVLKYEAGHVYEYAFDSILTVGVSSGVVSDADDTSLKVTGTAKVFAEGNCGYTLQLAGVKVTNTKGSVDKKITSSIQKPVHFTLVNGQLVPDICADSSDSEYSLNIKRGVISLLQSGSNTDGQQDGHEVDVFGQCPTHTSVSKSGNGNAITKVRNLNNCAHREQINSGLVSGIVNERAGIRSSLLLHADYSKELKIENGIVHNVQLAELYKFTGTYKGNSDVTAKVLTTLKLKNKDGAAAAAAPATGNHRSSIIFQKPDTYAAKNIAVLKTTLSELVDLTTDYVKKDSAKKFVELIRLLRSADTETLLELASIPHPNKVQARKVYLDALFRTNTAESAKAILKQLGKLEDKEKIIAILSLNFVETVDKETVTIATAQLTPNAPKEVFLSVGKLVSKYCAQNGCEQTEVEPISKKFVDNLKHCKANTKKDEERIVYVLKGIGNAEHLANNVAAALVECASGGRSNRIRVAALQSFSAVGCNPTLQSKALELLKDHNEDSELRIEAYLAAIQCPNAQVANEIAEIVNSEKVYQVGGFIASNLKAIRDSTDPTREQQKYHLGNIRVTKQFPKDYRRYSFNNEFSYKLDALGVSASSDYKLIYSQHGFLPRSARLNITSEIFGTNFNLFEASVRQENLENVLEYYIGPKGLLNKDFEENIKLIEMSATDAAGGAGSGAGGRARRSIADDATKVSKKYKTYGSKNVNDLNLDLSLKLFGSELAFLSLGDNIPGSLDDIIKHFSAAFDKAKKELSSFEKEFACHNIFLDTDFVYPTGVGIPLELSAQGIAASKIDFAINLDVSAILELNWQRAKYRLKVVPSVDVNVNLQLGFNAQVLSTGLRLTTTGHTSTGSDISVGLIKNGDGFNVDVEMPRDKLELIDIEAAVEFYVAEQDKPLKSVALKGAKKPTNTETCYNQLNDFGVELCFDSTIVFTDLTAPATTDGDKKAANAAIHDIFHLSRPFKLSIYAVTEKKYNLQGTYETLPTGSQQWKLNFNTPGSKVSHDTNLIFELASKPRMYGRLSFDNTHLHLAVEAGINNDNHELVIYGQYEQDKDIKKSKIGFTKKGNEYHPVIEIQDKNGVTNNIKGYSANGKVVVQQTGEKQSRYNFENFQISNPNNEHVKVNGWADVGPTSFNSELHIAPGQHSYLVKGNFKLDNGQYAAGFFINDERAPDNVYGGSLQLGTGEQQFDLKLTGKAVSWSVDSATNLEYVIPEGQKTVRSSKFAQTVNVQHKGKPVGSGKLNAVTDLNKFELQGEIARVEKLASVNVKFESNQRSVNDYSLVANAKITKHSIDLIAKCDVNGNVYNVDNSLTTSWGTSLTAKGEVGQRFTPQDVHIDLTGSAQIAAKDKPIQWILKVIGAADKTNSEFRVNRDNSELVKFTGETQHPQDKISAGKLQLILKNLLTAKGDFKIAKNGKGELTAIVETQKTEPKHKIEIDTKFTILAPKYDIDTTLILDGDKKLNVKTENVVDKQKFTTKNVIEAGDKKIAFEANGSVKNDWRTNGEIQGNFVLTAPNGHIVDGTINRKVNTNAKTGIAQGSMDVQLNDKEPSGKKRTIDFNGKLERYNSRTKELSVSSQLAYTGSDNQKTELNYHVKHLAKGNGKSLDVKVAANGQLLAQPVEVTIVLDEYDREHAVGHVAAKYGDKAKVNVKGNYHAGDQQSKPFTYEILGNLQVPELKIKSVEVNSHGKFLKQSTGGEANANTNTNGNYNIEWVIDAKTGDGKFARLNTGWKGTQQQGTYNLEASASNWKAPLKLDGSYQTDQSGSLNDGNLNGKRKYAFNVNAGDDKYLKTGVELSYAAAETATLRYTLDTSYESLKNIEIDLRSHKGAEDTYVIAAQLKNGGQTYGLDTKLYRSTHKKGIDVHANLPTGQPIVVVAIVELLGEHKTAVTLNIENLADLDLKVNGEASYTNINEFYIVGKWSSKKLKLDDYDLDIRSQRKGVTATLKNAKGVVFGTTATFTHRKENNKVIVEGQGQVQYNGQAHQGNFKLIKQVFDLDTEKEVGFAYTFNGNFGSKNGVSTLKITNKEFNTKLSICEEKKQCTNVQVQSIVQESEPWQHAVLILIDLRELGYPYEFKLNSKTTRNGFTYQHNIDGSLVSGNNIKYQLQAHVLPTSTIVKLILPKREIVFETKQQLPKDGQVFGHYEQSVAFYVDKLNQPNDVARVSAILDVTGSDRTAVNAKGQLKLEHPTIRPLTISGHLDANREQRTLNTEVVIDTFRLPEQKITATSHIRDTQNSPKGFNVTTSQKVQSAGLQIDYDLNSHVALNTESKEISAGAEFHCGKSDVKIGAYLTGNLENVDVSVIGLGEELLHINGEFNRQKRTAKFNTKLQAFGQKPIQLTSEIQPTLAKIAIKRDNLIDANAELKLGKEFKVDVVGGGKPLFNGRIALDAANFLQTTYKSNDQDISAYLKSVEDEVKQETKVATEKINQRFEKLQQLVDQQVKLAKESTPDFKKLISAYDGNAKALVIELESDPSLKHIFEAVRNLQEKLPKIVEKIVETTTEAYKKIHDVVIEIYNKVLAVWRDALSKTWEEFVVNASKLIGQLQTELLNAYTKALKEILAILEKYTPALKNYGKAITESLKPLQEATQEIVKVVVQASEELFNEIQEYIAQLPTFESVYNEISDKLQKLKVLENVLIVVNGLFDQLNILPLTPETQELLQKLHEYVVAKLKQTPVNDEKVLDELSRLLLKALNSIWTVIENNGFVIGGAGGANVPSGDLHGWLNSLPLSLDAITKLPALTSFRFSAINLLVNENWENVFTKELFGSWVFFKDFELRGHVVDGQHIFTFDGQHFAYPGNCKYILAQDSVDNNFTVVAQLQNAKLKSIALADRDGNVVEVSDNIALKVNGKLVEYPQHLPGVHAWRRYYTVHLHSEYGVTVMCTTDLSVCHVEVSGFYTSKTRGLLGNGNAEPYDDYLLIDGTLATDSAALGNEYGLGKCQPIAFAATQVESEHHAEICNDIFGIESPLALSYLALDSRPYRKACDIAVNAVSAEKDKESVACNFALSYGSALREQNLFAMLPTRCLKCPGPVGQRDVGDLFTVKVPNNKADVAFVVDINVTPAVLSQLVAPAITEIRESLKSRGFTDVQVAVVVFDAAQRYPALLTSDNGKLNYKGNVANVQLHGPKNFCDNCVEQIITEKRILDIYNILERVIKSIVPQSDEKAFDLVLDYPFRAGAAKSIVAVRSDNLEYNNWWKVVRAQVAGAVTKFDGALLHLIAPVKGLSVEGIPSEKLIGFNSRLVATVDGKDNKKRSKLEFDNDMGIDFVLNNGGWVFSTQNFDKLKAPEQKKVLNQVTSSIADTLFKTEIVSDCVCVPIHGLHGQHKCSTKSSSFVPNKKPKAA